MCTHDVTVWIANFFLHAIHRCNIKNKNNIFQDNIDKKTVKYL